MQPRLSHLLLAATLAFAPTIALADDGGHSLEELVVGMADSPSDHTALAEHFRAKAERARAEAKRHEHLARVYTGGKFMQREQMRAHCRKLSADHEAMAKEYDELAKLHEAEAKSAK